MAHKLAVAAAVALASLALAACGGGGTSGEGVATLGGGTTTEKTGSKDPEDAMLAYAECMRRNGADVPDPQDGAFVITPETQDNSGAGREKFEDADEKCRSHRENFRPPDLSDEEKAAMRDAMLKHARCMRERGIDVPDPRFDDSGRAAIPLDSLDLGDPKFQAAQKACEKHLRSRPGAD